MIGKWENEALEISVASWVTFLEILLAQQNFHSIQQASVNLYPRVLYHKEHWLLPCTASFSAVCHKMQKLFTLQI